jgi:hypothetical protein
MPVWVAMTDAPVYMRERAVGGRGELLVFISCIFPTQKINTNNSENKQQEFKAFCLFPAGKKKAKAKGRKVSR